MIQRAKKKTSFLLGVLVTGILGTIGGHLNSNYSRDSSLIVPTAKADIPLVYDELYGGGETINSFTGDGCGGSTGGSSGA